MELVCLNTPQTELHHQHHHDGDTISINLIIILHQGWSEALRGDADAAIDLHILGYTLRYIQLSEG